MIKTNIPMLFLSATTTLCAACGGGDGDNNNSNTSSTTMPTPTPQAENPSTSIETSGVVMAPTLTLAKLDRSNFHKQSTALALSTPDGLEAVTETTVRIIRLANETEEILASVKTDSNGYYQLDMVH